jgi:hypothetical protein
MKIVSWFVKGYALVDILPKGQTVNLTHCVQTLEELPGMFNKEVEWKLWVVQHWQIYFGGFVEERWTIIVAASAQVSLLHCTINVVIILV